MIKAIIFDCFGVLVGQGFSHTYKLAGGDPVKDRAFIDETLAKDNLGQISHKEFEDLIMSRLKISNDEWQRAISKAELPDIELLRYIKELRLKYKTAILSNANHGVLENKLGLDILGEYFDKIIISADVGLVKPDPRIYKLAAENLGVLSSECIFIDDKQNYVEAGRALGMKTVLFKDLNQLRIEISGLTA